MARIAAGAILFGILSLQNAQKIEPTTPGLVSYSLASTRYSFYS